MCAVDLVVFTHRNPRDGACARLDGLPLALELAAARVRLLPPYALLTRLESSLDVLRAPERDRPARHQTLRATLDWSFELLTEAERRVLTRLTAFPAAGTSRQRKRSEPIWIVLHRSRIRAWCNARTTCLAPMFASVCWRPCASTHTSACNLRQTLPPLRGQHTPRASWVWLNARSHW